MFPVIILLSYLFEKKKCLQFISSGGMVGNDVTTVLTISDLYKRIFR